jgi:hypothetical protein
MPFYEVERNALDLQDQAHPAPGLGARMNRRTFAVVGAGALALGATGAAAEVLKPSASKHGESVVLSGWLAPADNGATHYFVLGPDAHVADPGSTDPADWPRDLTIILPADTTKVAPGKVSLKGRLYRGRFQDLHTGRAAMAILTDATPV